jgi:CheY-like chemotaxis protein
MASAASPRLVVLVVDDEPILRINAADLLEDAGFETMEACDAAAALIQIERHPEISVLFTDINMPGPFDGLELARRVHRQRPDIRLIVTSGRGRPDDRDLPEGGCFVSKPYDAREVAALAAGA